eukprot:CAMPEP_0183607704 /NCGR_PEP_ID=MMETSP0371-20130417/183592_1 /TAXON_ID=268820 /ORGANISM="Peridinium aciculiferum, Strain PAER-2" /LENGTH=39 /DNA_ID= /DNA_START= /DNA_END= /DNA_ORIENTATION=
MTPLGCACPIGTQWLAVKLSRTESNTSPAEGASQGGRPK